MKSQFQYTTFWPEVNTRCRHTFTVLSHRSLIANPGSTTPEPQRVFPINLGYNEPRGGS